MNRETYEKQKKIQCITPILLFFLSGLPAYSKTDNFFFFSPGVTGGMHTVPAKTDYIIGGEISAGYFIIKRDYAAFFGVVTDGVYDRSQRSGRFMIGPEAGISLLGIDGGFLMEYRRKKLKTGFALRPFFTLPIPYPEINLIFYYRYNYISAEKYFSEFGFLLKFPIDLTRQRP